MLDYKFVDPFMNMPPSPEEARSRAMDPNIARWFKNSRTLFEGATPDEMVADMTANNIERAMVTIAGRGTPDNPYAIGQPEAWNEAEFEAHCQKFAALRAKYPGRIFGCIVVDPTGVMTAVRQFEHAVRDYGFSACWIMPSLVGLPANHPTYFPIYAKAVELGVPVRINVGVPGPLRFAAPQMPMPAIDEVCIVFPELSVVCAHVGHPWHVEMVALLQKHANLYLITSGYAPKHVPQELWRLANTRGAQKLMWSSDYPIMPMDRCTREAEDVPLKDEPKRRWIRENAIEVFKLY
jgi:predicted TIM-barrel fold metal-dependent hydrolase